MRAIVFGVVLGLAGSAQAQIVFRSGPGGGNDASALLDVAPSAYGVAGWKAGEWARYNVTQTFGATGQQLTRFRTISVVGSAQDKFWVEVQEESMGLMRTSQPVRKMLIPFGAVTDRAMTEALTLFPDSSIRRTTVLRPPAPDGAKPAFPEGWERAGEETLTTPAGDLKARHYTKGDEELWISAAAGPVGVVRYRGGNTTIELVGHGTTGAKSKIPEVAP